MPTTRSFTGKVYALARKIPRGSVATYADLARRLKRPRAARAVGNALHKSPGMSIRLPIDRAGLPAGRQVPCHRVVRSDGTVGGFARGTKAKIELLKKEGVEVEDGRVDMRRFGLKNFRK